MKDMQTQEMAEAIKILDLVEKMENLVGDFYLACATRCPVNGTFWFATARAEHAHAKVVATMKELMSKFPASFHLSPGRSSEKLTYFVARTVELVDQVTKGAYTEKDALIIALDIENSLIENCLSELLTSNIEDFGLHMSKIKSEELNHIAMLKMMVAEIDTDNTQV